MKLILNNGTKVIPIERLIKRPSTEQPAGTGGHLGGPITFGFLSYYEFELTESFPYSMSAIQLVDEEGKIIPVEKFVEVGVGSKLYRAYLN